MAQQQQSQDISYDAGYAIAQTTQRLNTMDDLLHRNEGSLTHVLNRMKDVEVALNTVHRVTTKYPPEMQLVLDDMTNIKRRVDAVDHSWRSKTQDLDQIIQQEVRNARPTPLANDPLYLRTVSEIQALRQESQDGQITTRRLGETSVAEAQLLRKVEQDCKWLTDQVRDQIAAHRDFSNTQTRRNEQLAAAIADESQTREKVDTQMQAMMDKALRVVREEFSVRFEAEAKARIALQNDVVSAFSRMREDVIKGFSQTATNLRNLDETTHSLETVLRAEVRSRMAHADDVSKRVEVVEERVRREATGAAEYLKQFDHQFNGAIRDVRDITQSEMKNQLDSVWRVIKELQENGGGASSGGGGIGSVGGGAGISAEKLDLMERRQKMQLETDLNKTREEILKTVDKRLEAGLPARDKVALKTDLDDVRQLINLKQDETIQAGRRSQLDGDFVTRSQFDSRLNTVEGRVDGSERNVTAVAEALHGAQRDLGDKVALMEKQARAMDAMQKNLQESWDRDQEQMEGYLQGIREQVMVLAESGREPNSGAQEATTTTFKLLEDELHGIRKEHKQYENANAVELAELRSQVETGTGPATAATTGPTFPHPNSAGLEARITKLEGGGGGGAAAVSGRRRRGSVGADQETVDALGSDLSALKTAQSKFEQKIMKELMGLRMEVDLNGGAAAPSRSASPGTTTAAAAGGGGKDHTREVEAMKKQFKKLYASDLPQLQESLEQYVDDSLVAWAEENPNGSGALKKKEEKSKSPTATKSIANVDDEADIKVDEIPQQKEEEASPPRPVTGPKEEPESIEKEEEAPAQAEEKSPAAAAAAPVSAPSASATPTEEDKLCTQCKKPVSGEYLEADGIILHPECEDTWQADNAPTCKHCSTKLLGEYVEVEIPGEVESATLHEECVEAFQKSVASKCAKCKEPMLNGGVAIGEGENEKTYHEACAPKEGENPPESEVVLAVPGTAVVAPAEKRGSLDRPTSTSMMSFVADSPATADISPEQQNLLSQLCTSLDDTKMMEGTHSPAYFAGIYEIVCETNSRTMANAKIENLMTVLKDRAMAVAAISNKFDGSSSESAALFWETTEYRRMVEDARTKAPTQMIKRLRGIQGLTPCVVEALDAHLALLTGSTTTQVIEAARAWHLPSVEGSEEKEGGNTGAGNV